jgi:hypothetical protein
MLLLRLLRLPQLRGALAPRRRWGAASALRSGVGGSVQRMGVTRLWSRTHAAVNRVADTFRC